MAPSRLILASAVLLVFLCRDVAGIKCWVGQSATVPLPIQDPVQADGFDYCVGLATELTGFGISITVLLGTTGVQSIGACEGIVETAFQQAAAVAAQQGATLALDSYYCCDTDLCNPAAGGLVPPPFSPGESASPPVAMDSPPPPVESPPPPTESPPPPAEVESPPPPSPPPPPPPSPLLRSPPPPRHKPPAHKKKPPPHKCKPPPKKHHSG